MGDVQLDLSDYPGADRSYRASHVIREKLAEKNEDEPRFQLARSFANLSTYQTRTRAFSTAISHQEKVLEIREELVKKRPDVADYASELAEAHQRDGRTPTADRGPKEPFPADLEKQRTLQRTVKSAAR